LAAFLLCLGAHAAAAAEWVHDGSATPQARALIAGLRSAELYGLRAQDYVNPDLDVTFDPSGTDESGRRLGSEFDVSLNAAATRFVHDVHFGRVDPRPGIGPYADSVRGRDTHLYV
jgi:hypothetical protein